MRLARLSEMSDQPEGFEKKTFQISSKKFVSLKKVLTFAAAIETIAKKVL